MHVSVCFLVFINREYFSISVQIIVRQRGITGEETSSTENLSLKIISFCIIYLYSSYLKYNYSKYALFCSEFEFFQ